MDMELVNFIRESRESGLDDQQITDILMQNGWDFKTVDKLLGLMEPDFKNI